MEPIMRMEGRPEMASLMRKLGKSRETSGDERVDEAQKDREANQSQEANQSPDSPKKPDVDTYEPERERDSKKSSSPQKSESCRANTDKVDREIEKLKQKEAELEKKLTMEKDESKKKELEKELSNVKRELQQKDNDAYRRSHTVFS